MMSKQTQFVILCEDKQQEIFVRKYLEVRGINRRKVTSKICPGGQQAGEQYVREQYNVEVKTFRRKQRENRALVIVIDADTQTVSNRIEQLDQQLEQANLPRRSNSERIAIFVPKRNIETWIAFTGGKDVDEMTSYPKLAKESDCTPLVQHLAINVCPNGLPGNAPESLHLACNELQRVL